MPGTYYATQGGGTAHKTAGNQFVWTVPPEGIGAQPGDLIPDEWDIAGPFDSETNQLVASDEFDDKFDELYDY